MIRILHSFQLILICLFLSGVNHKRCFAQVVNVPNVGSTYVDENTTGGPWALIGYGSNGKLGSTLTKSSGALESSRDGSFTLNAVNAARKTGKFVISWNAHGFPSGGINSYDHAISFEFPDPSEITLSSEAVPPAGAGTSHWSRISTSPSTALVDVTTVKGSPNLPAKMYIRRETFGVNSGNAYGLVFNSDNNQLDWNPDSQNFNVVYIGKTAFGLIADGAGGIQNSYSPSTLAIWVKLPEEDQNATVSGRVNYDGS